MTIWALTVCSFLIGALGLFFVAMGVLNAFAASLFRDAQWFGVGLTALGLAILWFAWHVSPFQISVLPHL